MTTTALDDLLTVPTLTGLVKTFADQAGNRACTEFFRRHGKPLFPLGESVSWDEVEYARHLAPISGPESPHTRAKRLGVKKRSSAMAYVKVYKDLPASHLFLSRAPGLNSQDAEQILASELEDLGNLLGATIEFLSASALSGKIVVTAATVPGSDVFFEVDFGVANAPSAASWADPATKIRSEELARIKQVYKDGSGNAAEVVIAPASVDGLLVKNTETRELIKDSLGVAILQNLPLSGVSPALSLLGGLRFQYMDGTYKPEGGPVTRYLPEHSLVVLPHETRLPQVLGFAEGRVHVPAGPLFGKPESTTGLVTELRGYYAYAELRTDPIGIRVYAGWHGLPLVLNPSSVLNYRIVP
jgi:hypothetical protein